MEERNKKTNLQGMEHLKKMLELDDSSDTKSENAVGIKDNYIKHELLQILIIMLFLFVSLFIIVYIDKQNNFLHILAEKINNYI